MVRALVGLIGRDPFKPLQAHMGQVIACVNLLRPLMEGVLDGDVARVAEVRKAITKAEHEADRIKNELRDHLPRSLFLPVARTDLLQLLHHQDNLADGAEDAAVLASLRALHLPAELRADAMEFTEQSLAAAETAQAVISRMEELLEASFTGPGADGVLELIARIGQQEWETDKAAFTLIRGMIAHDDRPDDLDVMLWMKLLEAIGDVANSAEQVGDHLRLMLSK